MADFPENGVKVFEFVDLFESFDLGEVRRALERANEPINTHPGSPTRTPADVQRARSRSGRRDGKCWDSLGIRRSPPTCPHCARHRPGRPG